VIAAVFALGAIKEIRTEDANASKAEGNRKGKQGLGPEVLKLARC